MIRRLPLPAIYLAFLLVWLYFAIVSGEKLALLGLVCLLVCCFRFYPLKKVGQLLLILTLFASYISYQEWLQTIKADSAPQTIQRIQVLPDTISVNGDKLSFRGHWDNQTYQAFYKLTSEKEQRFFKTLTQSVVLDIEAELTEPEGQRNFKGFDYSTYLKSQGIYRLVQIDTIKTVHKAKRLSLFEIIRGWRRKALVHIYDHFPSPMKHYMTGLLFGHLSKEFEEMSDLYSSLGIIHLFALSGMQVGFFAGAFRYLFLWLGLRKDWVDWLTVPFSLVYAGMTGFSVSVIRSLIQLNLSSLGFRGLDNFAATVMVMFLIMPNFLLTTGGVLSFAYSFILAMTDFKEMKHPRLAEMLTINLGILPLLMWYFASFQPLAILLTAVVSIAFDSLILPLLSLIFICSPLVRIDFVNFLFVFLEKGLTLIGQFFNRPVIFGSPSLIVLVLVLVCLGLLYDVLRCKKWAIGLSLMVALLFIITKHPIENEVTVVDIGQGDSIFLRDMTGKTLLIDVGGKADFAPKEAWRKGKSDANAERTLIPYLKSRGVHQIDQLLLTHTDTDHIGDMEVVAKAFSIGEIIVSQGSLTVPSFVERLKALHVPVKAMAAGDKISIMGSQLQVLYPATVGNGENNDSLVLYGKLLDKRFLFTGDLEEGELDLIKRYPNLPVDILKAGHHGSKGSSYPEFLNHIGAEVALVSAGKNNRYKHPHQETLERFKKENMTVYRTDQQGAIRFHGWQKWQVETVR
ncbi:DNA internalization-related competence protein ComEC/Rec2 [Streptococcus hillyeri]|uniref:DNA internalization-related competence protein ComEC/Rec2 n=1 Tax=Streptococcus hillyeri TaxID=2282420 RepID=UPI0034E26519